MEANVKKIDAAKELLEIYNLYEPRKVKLKTILNKMFKDRERGTWRVIGYQHDYSY